MIRRFPLRSRPLRNALLALALLLCAGPPAALGQPVVHVASGVELPEHARAVLVEILQEAGVRSARVTSGYRSPEAQVRVMHGYLERNGIGAARSLYGPEGQAVITAYEANRTAGRARRLALMEAELRRQLPSAFANKRLMHLHPCYVTFDVSMRSIPAARHDAFSRAAERHPGVHRFLGKGQGEKEAFHVEIPKPGDCTAPQPEP